MCSTDTFCASDSSLSQLLELGLICQHPVLENPFVEGVLGEDKVECMAVITLNSVQFSGKVQNYHPLGKDCVS